MRNSARMSVISLMAVMSACAKTEQPPAPVVARAIPDVVESPASAAESAISQIGHYASVSEGRNAAITATTAQAQAAPVGNAPQCVGSQIRPAKCSGGVVSSVWNGCLDSNSLIATGGVTDHFLVTSTSSAEDAACNDSLHPPGLVKDGVKMLRQIPMMSFYFGAAWKGNTLQGSKLVVDTAPAPAWDGTTFDSRGTEVFREGGRRRIKINGTHERLTSFSGKVIYDYSHAGEISLTGSLGAGDRAIENGSQLVTWNNSGAIKAVHTFTNDSAGNPVRWTKARCCFPTQGQVSSVYSGQVSGTTTMTFTGCGKASFVGIDGAKKAISLARCL